MLPEEGYLLRIFIGESDRHDGKLLHEWIVMKAREEGLAGATVIRAMMGFGEVKASADYTEGGLMVTPIENNRRADALRKIVATVPPPGTNVIVVTHKPNILDAFGKDWFDVREGEASIFKPDGKGGYTLVARVQAVDWAKLAQAAP